MNLFYKILTAPRTTIPLSVLRKEKDLTTVKTKIEAHVRRLFQGSLTIREVAAGSSNAEEQEVNALSNSFYDSERFGIKFVASPRHADMLLVSGPVARNMGEALKKTYAAMSEPKIVVAVGDGAIDGGIFRGSYAVYDGVHEVIPVNFQIPGDPPSPKAMLVSLLHILDLMHKSN